MADLELGPLRFGIVGAGRLGCVIARGLQTRGFDVVAASSHSAAGRAAASHKLDIPVFDDPFQTTVDVDVVVICVPDDTLPAVVQQLVSPRSSATTNRLRVLHTSGCESLDVLDPLRIAGHEVLSVHPLQTVTARCTHDDLIGAAAAVTAHDVTTRTFGHAFAHALDMLPFDLDDAARPLYHAASVFAANFTVTLHAAVRDIAREAGMHEQLARAAFARLAHAALERIEHEGPEAALTGPIVRGDGSSIAAHLTALEQHLPSHARLYRELAHSTVHLAMSAGALDVDGAARLDSIVTDTAAGEPTI